MQIPNKFSLGSEVNLRTGDVNQKWLVRQINISMDGSWGYLLAFGSANYFALEDEIKQPETSQNSIGFQLR